MKEFCEIINSIETNKANINPTEIYNEGWMVRLLVLKSIEEKKMIGDINFSKIKNWTSEGLISSPFVKAPEKREGYTHADIALGDFTVDYKDSGEIKVNDDANIFGIIEAKMGSNLSKGTTHAPSYNQASRNIACILSNTSSSANTFFCVVAPEKSIEKHKIDEQISIEEVHKEVENRFSDYDDEFKNKHNANEILNRIDSFNSFTIAYESWIDMFDGEVKNDLKKFYKKALKWNKLNHEHIEIEE